MKKNIGKLHEAAELLDKAPLNMDVAIKVLNEKCGEKLKECSEKLDELYPTAQLIIAPTLCQKISLICTMKAKMAALTSKIAETGEHVSHEISEMAKEAASA